MTEHTPTPWKTENGYHGGKIIVRVGADKNEADITGTYMDSAYVSVSDAEFIVRSCNCHDELVEALMSFINDADDMATYSPETYDKARTALSKAKEVTSHE